MGLIKWLGDTVNDFLIKKAEAYEWAQDGSWSSIYDQLRGEKFYSAKGQGLMQALGEKLEGEDICFLQQFYEHEAEHLGEKKNPCGFVTLKRFLESRGANEF